MRREIWAFSIKFLLIKY